MGSRFLTTKKRSFSKRMDTRSSRDRLRFLVVFAHPDAESFSSTLCRTTVDALTAAGHHVDLIDLYAEDFDPRLTTAEREAYESSAPLLSAEIERHAELLRRAQGLILIYPTWWWGLPAILKGWLERVFVPGVAFALDPATNKVKSSLGELRWVMGVTTYGSSRSAMRFFNDSGRRNVLRCVRMLAPKVGCRTKWLGLYALDRSTTADRERFIARVRTTMGSL